jgi:hypothetical protein
MHTRYRGDIPIWCIVVNNRNSERSFITMGEVAV